MTHSSKTHISTIYLCPLSKVVIEDRNNRDADNTDAEYRQIRHPTVKTRTISRFSRIYVIVVIRHIVQFVSFNLVSVIYAHTL